MGGGQAVQKRHRRQTGVMPSQMAAQLTAAQIATARSIAQLYKRECLRSRGDAGETDATLTARRMMMRNDIQARWVSTSLLQVWPCRQVDPEGVTFRRTKKCYRFLPISVEVENRMLDGFLDPITRVLSTSSPEINCQLTPHLLEMRPEEYWQIDAKTGKRTLLDPSRIHSLPVTHTVEEEELRPLTFHVLELNNWSTVFPGKHVEELLRLTDWATHSDFTQDGMSKALGALEGGLTGVIERKFWDVVSSLKNRWIEACALYTTILLVRNLIIPLIAWLALPAWWVIIPGLQQRRRRPAQRSLGVPPTTPVIRTPSREAAVELRHLTERLHGHHTQPDGPNDEENEKV